MKKLGPVFLVVLILLIGYKIFLGPVGGEDLLEDMDLMIDTMVLSPEEDKYVTDLLHGNHKAAFRAAQSVPQPDGDTTMASRAYRKHQFLHVIDRSRSDGMDRLAAAVQQMGYQTLGPREFPAATTQKAGR